MASIPVQQALYYRAAEQPPTLQARSPGFADAWLSEAERLIVGFGARPVGIACPLTVFAQPLTSSEVAVVRVVDQGDTAARVLAGHVLVLDRRIYEGCVWD